VPAAPAALATSGGENSVELHVVWEPRDYAHRQDESVDGLKQAPQFVLAGVVPGTVPTRRDKRCTRASTFTAP
jgi:hypothetical protein